ncbi:MAG: hypothetical protein SU899_02425, partial [Chloroflexota bacterium]|nr:hypothetical protein [Chloroflexota bacterium]
ILVAERANLPSFAPPPPPEELIDMVRADSRVQELLDKGAKVIGAAGSQDVVSVILELDEVDRWVVEIDLATKEVTKVESMEGDEFGKFVFTTSMSTQISDGT